MMIETRNQSVPVTRKIHQARPNSATASRSSRSNVVIVPPVSVFPWDTILRAVPDADSELGRRNGLEVAGRRVLDAAPGDPQAEEREGQHRDHPRSDERGAPVGGDRAVLRGPAKVRQDKRR